MGCLEQSVGWLPVHGGTIWALEESKLTNKVQLFWILTIVYAGKDRGCLLWAQGYNSMRISTFDKVIM